LHEKENVMATAVRGESRISLLSPLVGTIAPCESGGEIGNALNSQWEHLECELLRLRDLESDWDGQGSLPPDVRNIEAARHWIGEMRHWPQAMPPRRAIPGTAGEVILEWRGEAFQLAAEIHTPDRIEWLLDVPGQPIRQWETDLRATWLVRTESVPSPAGDSP
jgi:hypothetical protein